MHIHFHGGRQPLLADQTGLEGWIKVAEPALRSLLSCHFVTEAVFVVDGGQSHSVIAPV